MVSVCLSCFPSCLLFSSVDVLQKMKVCSLLWCLAEALILLSIPSSNAAEYSLPAAGTTFKIGGLAIRGPEDFVQRWALHLRPRFCAPSPSHPVSCEQYVFGEMG